MRFLELRKGKNENGLNIIGSKKKRSDVLGQFIDRANDINLKKNETFSSKQRIQSSSTWR